ncbi:PI31-Prot-N multi-domain protein [Pyrenophora tritici-repentis]|nr:PI31-Prot-N multi-domain protein [Pyrenophora tritici-repentis]KAI1556270.1 PI31-Prot-N multi-domain protein [Pyrenophora tritici-repentis]KAI1579765.1 PI31-Prot-N multi-domain protein [Pyrenophora tritici-repentis]KAI1600723.1 PI31-Prot-N multi-domain protein [Pyrenophora tritici-repentis]PWO31018.1 mitochondrial protein [Pyrenophora tritici-repentis]
MVLENTTGNPLSAGSLALFMATSFPKGDASKLKNGTEAVALAVHAGMLAVGFRLIGLGEDERIDAENPQALPAKWNASSTYEFRYAHAQSAMEYLVKVNRLGGKAVVYALALGDDKTTNFEVTTKDYISESQLPFSVSEDTPTEQVSQKVQELFISAGRLNDLGSLLKISVIQKLAPGINKPEYEESSTDSQPTSAADRHEPERGEPHNPRQPPTEPGPARPHPFDDPLAARPHSGRHLPEPIPRFDDELGINQRPGRLPEDRYPVNIGHDDLYPQGLGPNDPLRAHLAGGLPRPGGFGGGGMHPTFDDPLFRGQGGQGGYDPMAPPGARYDIVAPGDPRREDRGRGPMFPGRGAFGGPGAFGGAGGRPPNPFGGFGDGDFI